MWQQIVDVLFQNGHHLNGGTFLFFSTAGDAPAVATEVVGGSGTLHSPSSTNDSSAFHYDTK